MGAPVGGWANAAYFTALMRRSIDLGRSACADLGRMPLQALPVSINRYTIIKRGQRHAHATRDRDPGGLCRAGGDQTKARDKNDTRYTGGAATIDSIQVQLVDSDGNGVPGLSVCPTGQAPYPMQCVIGTSNSCATSGSDGKAAFGKGLCWDGTGDWNVKIIANVPGQAQANVTTRGRVTN
jgi:hypothetical protein